MQENVNDADGIAAMVASKAQKTVLSASVVTSTGVTSVEHEWGVGAPNEITDASMLHAEATNTLDDHDLPVSPVVAGAA